MRKFSIYSNPIVKRNKERHRFQKNFYPKTKSIAKSLLFQKYSNWFTFFNDSFTHTEIVETFITGFIQQWHPFFSLKQHSTSISLS